jgi:hypothetical protein
VPSLERIESAIPADAYFEWDLSSEDFLQRALRDYVQGWARRKPFYVRRMGIAAISPPTTVPPCDVHALSNIDILNGVHSQ